MLQKFARFMMGRYGNDQFNFVLLILAFVISIFGQLFNFHILVFIAYAILIYSLFRTFSRNIDARRKEYYKFLKYYNPVVSWFKLKRQAFSQRKTYTYFKCPNCKQQLRAPKGRGKIRVTCQRCHTNFEKKV